MALSTAGTIGAVRQSYSKKQVRGPARILGQAPVRRHSTNLFYLGTPKGSLYDDFLSS